MRRIRRFVFVVAVVVAAIWWFDLRPGAHIGVGITDEEGEREPVAIEAVRDGTDTAVDQVFPSDWATLDNFQSTVGPPQDVTDAQREELVAYLHERWPYIMTDYGFAGVKRVGWDPEDGGYIGYRVEFAADNQIGTQRTQTPVIGCGFSVRHSSWHCISPVLEPVDAAPENETED